MRPKHLIFFLLMTISALAQIPAPQVNLTGNIGCVGFPCVNSGTLIFTVDANRTMTALETSAFNIKLTSSVTLTATRNLISPAGRFSFTIENATTGGQAIQIIGASGLGVTIANGTTVAVWNDGTNFVQVGAASSGGGPFVSTNGIGNASQTLLNFINPSTFNGLTATFSNPSGGSETFALGGALGNAGLANSSVTLGSTSVPLGGTIASAAGFNAATATLAANSTLFGGIPTSGFCQTGGAGCPTGSGITGTGTANFYSLWTGTNTQSTGHITDASGVIGMSEAVHLNDGTGNAGVWQPAVGTDPGGATGSATYTTDATNGFAEVHEGTAALTRICTAANASSVTGCQPTGSGITALTGPVTASGTGSVATTITATGVTAGSYTSANVTVNAAGQVTAASNGSGGGTVSNCTTAGLLAYYAATGTTLTCPSGVSYAASGSTWPSVSEGLGTSPSIGLFSANANSVNVQTQFRNQQGGTDAFSSIVGAADAINGAAIHQVNGVAGFTTNEGAAQAVGVYGQSVCDGTGSQCYGMNGLVASTATFNANLLIGYEADVNINNTGDCSNVCDGIRVAGGWGAIPTNPTFGYHLTKPLGTGQWTTGFYSAAGAAATAFWAGPTASSGASLASQPITFVNFDSGSVLRSSTINADATSDIVIAPFSALTKITGSMSTTSNINDGAIGSSTNPICTTTGGQLTNSGCSDSVSYAVGAGSVNALTATLPATALTTGLEVDVLPNLANTTTTPTFNMSGTGAKTITKLGTAVLVAGDISTTAIAKLIYDGTGWELQNPQTVVTAYTGTAPIVVTGSVISCPTCGTSTPVTTWTVDDFINSAAFTLFNMTGTSSQGTLVWSAGSVGHNAVWTLSQSSTATNAFETWTNPNFPLIAGSGGAFSVAASVEDTANATGPGVVGIGSSGTGPNPSQEASFHCDNGTLGNNHWWTYIQLTGGGGASTVDTGVTCLNVWHTLEVSVSGTTATFYIDGTSEGSGTISAVNYAPFFAAWDKASTLTSIVVDWMAIKTATPGLI